MVKQYEIAGFFAGAGGLDRGFENKGFLTVYANEYDKKIIPTYKANFPHVNLDSRSLFNVPGEDVPDNLTGFIGGPPCQSWSVGGLGKGLADKRGEVFLKYIELIKQKQPLFFLAENVKGMLAKTRENDLERIIKELENTGYNLSYQLLNANHYNTPQDRERLIFVGYRKDLGETFVFPEPATKPGQLTLKHAIWDLRDTAVPAEANDTPNSKLVTPNHEFSTGSFSPQYMSRNRIRSWGQPSFTIQASGRQAPLHPDSGTMSKVHSELFQFDNPTKVRRLTVRETARIQTFPDSYKFLYNKVDLGYKMVGNAVPVKMAETIAQKIFEDLQRLGV